MAKIERKSIADIIGLKTQSRKPSAEEIDKITQEIHQPDPTPLQPEMPQVSEEKIKRISVNASVSLYLKAKTKATMQDQTLMAYIIGLMERDLN